MGSNKDDVPSAEHRLIKEVGYAYRKYQRSPQPKAHLLEALFLLTKMLKEAYFETPPPHAKVLLAKLLAVVAPPQPDAPSKAAVPSKQDGPPADRVLKAMRKQVEYYFSDKAFAHDNFLKSNLDADGFVSLRLVCGFNRLAGIARDISHERRVGYVRRALRDSPLVELSADGSRLRRRPSVAAQDEPHAHQSQLRPDALPFFPLCLPSPTALDSLGKDRSAEVSKVMRPKMPKETQETQEQATADDKRAADKQDSEDTAKTLAADHGYLAMPKEPCANIDNLHNANLHNAHPEYPPLTKAQVEMGRLLRGQGQGPTAARPPEAPEGVGLSGVEGARDREDDPFARIPPDARRRLLRDNPEAAAAEDASRMPPAAGKGGASSSTTMAAKVVQHVCAQCGRTNESLRKFPRCARCFSVRYCSRECQKGNWAIHMKTCAPALGKGRLS